MYINSEPVLLTQNIVFCNQWTWTLQASFQHPGRARRERGSPPPPRHTITYQNNYHFMEELANCYHFWDIKRLRANTQRNNKILRGP